MLALAVLVSGILPILVQGYAWLDMAEKAGGINQLGVVMTEAEPCEICDAARDLAERTSSGDNLPVPVERIDILKTMAFLSSVSIDLATERPATEFQFPFPADSTVPAGLRSGPAPPPPRSLAA